MRDAFPADVLLWPAAFIAIAGFLISLKVTRAVGWSVFLAVFKSAIYLFYFGLIFDGTYTFLDDWSYFYGGLEVKEQGIGLLNLLGHLSFVRELAGGGNLLYYVFDADSFRLFGEGYYAPVALNVAMTFITAAFSAGIARTALGFSDRRSMQLFIFMAVAPDIVAWSTVMNGKDPLILAATMAFFYAISQIEATRYARCLIVGVPALLILFLTRFYIPIMLLSAIFVAVMLSSNVRRKPLLWIITAAALTVMYTIMGRLAFSSAWDLVLKNFVNPLYGGIRFLLTPIPFNTEPSYAFLNVPQLIYWLFIPALVYGVIRAWRIGSLTSRFMVVYFVIMFGLYSTFGDLQGPRHRVQIDGLIVLFQFLGLIGFMRKITERSNHGPTALGNFH